MTKADLQNQLAKLVTDCHDVVDFYTNSPGLAQGERPIIDLYAAIARLARLVSESVVTKD